MTPAERKARAKEAVTGCREETHGGPSGARAEGALSGSPPRLPPIQADWPLDAARVCETHSAVNIRKEFEKWKPRRRRR